MNRFESAALDNYITGHYGADQFRGSDEFDEFVEHTCSNCMFEKDCPTFEKFLNGDDYEPCLIIKDIEEQRQIAEHEMDLRMEDLYRQECERDD